ncbi:MAG: fatty acid desaturase [Planctomycetes bacterium]|nr:fatty acid desaturase [Planctomycetota bacterium]
MSTAEPTLPGGFKPRWTWGMIGSAAPVFPGFEVDICDRVPDDEKPDAVWHRERAREMLQAHPEIKELFGHYPLTAVWCVLMAGTQLGIAAAMSHFPWWVAILTAYLVGALLNITLFQLAHECDHLNVFRTKFWNRYLFTLTSIPMFLSAHHTWWTEHIVHHNDMSATKDFITRRRSYFLATRRTSPLFIPYSLFMVVMQVARSLFGLTVYLFTSLLRGRLEPTRFAVSVLADEHLVSGYEKEKITKFAVVYPLLSFLTYGALFWYGYQFGGWTTGLLPLLYLMMSQVFFTGYLHPYCLGWVLGISHFHGRRNYQPTASHYGRLINLTTFNAGLHVEHHDIAGIPWFRLWKLREMAPEYFNNLEPIRSYTALGLQFVFAGREKFEDNFNTETHRNLQRFGESKTA